MYDDDIQCFRRVQVGNVKSCEFHPFHPTPPNFVFFSFRTRPSNMRVTVVAISITFMLLLSVYTAVATDSEPTTSSSGKKKGKKFLYVIPPPPEKNCHVSAMMSPAFVGFAQYTTFSLVLLCDDHSPEKKLQKHNEMRMFAVCRGPQSSWKKMISDISLSPYHIPCTEPHWRRQLP